MMMILANCTVTFFGLERRKQT